ncbi:MAG: orotidine-5'-phosphate decarboxylase [Nitrosomonas sp.]|nr:orotidine-5'-phosphate decarboxylase [Nitrosomonas sp.]
MSDPRIIVALDFSDQAAALEFVARLDRKLCRLKVGKELFTRAGPQLIDKLMRLGFEIFLDLKFHDIPNTAASACAAAASLGVWMINVHALGGRKMLLACRESLYQKKTKLIAVTLLTSLQREDLDEIGLFDTPEHIVQRLAMLTQQCGLDGVVCSALETAQLKLSGLGEDFLLVTPGIRLADSNQNDQARVATPFQAVRDGADYLVIGRPITQAADPLEMLERINREICSGRS